MHNPRTLQWAAAGLCAIIIAVFFRLYPVTVYPYYAAKSNAELIVYSKIWKAAETKVRRVYPEESHAKQNETLQKQFSEFLRKERSRIDRLIGTTTRQLVTQKRPHYLLEADPYYYLELTQHILATGTIAKKVEGHKYFNDRMMAPNGWWYPLDYHPYTGYLTHRMISFFNKNASLMESVSLTPIFLTALCLVAFFFMSSRILRLGALASFISAVYFTLIPIFLKRSLFGWYDTDPYNVLFPCLIVLFLLSSRISLAILVTAAYCLFWRGFFLMFGVIAVSFMFSAAFSTDKKKNLISALVYSASPVLFFPFIWGAAGLEESLKEASGFIRGFFHPSLDLWPDVFLSVGELKPSTFLSMSDLQGNLFLYGFAGLGLASEFILSFKKNGAAIDRRITATLLAILAITSLLGLGFERFVILMTVPAAAGFALGLRRIFLWIERRKYFPGALKITLSAAILAGLCAQAHQTARFERPIYNSSWDKMMRTLKNKTPADSIITSWWSPGHFITAMADRRVTFDGATQNTPRAYWVSNFFLADTEEKALGILRMLNSGRDPVGQLLKKNIRLSEAVRLARETRSKKDDPPLPPSYVFVYDNLIDSALAMEYIGNWDFSKAEAFNALIKKYPHMVPKKVLKRASKENVELAWSIAGGPWAQDRESYEENRDGSYVYFGNGLKLRTDLSDAELASKKFGSGRVKSVFYMESGVFKEKKFGLQTLGISALLVREKQEKGEIWKTVLADERLVRSLLFRLFYLKGEGLEHFKLFASEESIENRNRFYIYEAKFDQ